MRRCLLAVGALLIVSACGSRTDLAAANQDLLAPIYSLPNATPVSVEHYGYDLGPGSAADNFFTEVQFEADGRADAGEVIEAVERRLGDDWEMAEHEGNGDAHVATFTSGNARISVTTWDGGFDVTAAADGAKLDGTPLAL